MYNKIVISEIHANSLRELMFDKPGIEGAAFILCGQSISALGNKLISNFIIPIKDEEYLLREPYRLSISSAALARVTKLARHENLSIVFAHSHPRGSPDFSDQDDQEEDVLLPFLQKRVQNRIHGTLVMNESDFRGRLYSPKRAAATEVNIVGNQFRRYAPETMHTNACFDRQVRAFGNDAQQLLTGLNIGIVGLGGTGSPIAEQLCRLGVGNLYLFDGDKFEDTNVNRVYGSSIKDAGEYKVIIAKNHIERIGLGTNVYAYPRHITHLDSAMALRDCDIIFGCTDKELPRAILQQLALRYSIPVIDLGVLVDSNDGKILSVHGRVTMLKAGEACLFCRGRISAERIRIETLSDEDRQKQIKDGYAPELETHAPAVIAFTSGTASFAISELLQRLTGFMGEERQSSEVLIAFDLSRIRTNRVSPNPDCMCVDQAIWGAADTKPFLDMMWKSD